MSPLQSGVEEFHEDVECPQLIIEDLIDENKLLFQ
jgi:hypothetical protein